MDYLQAWLTIFLFSLQVIRIESLSTIESSSDRLIGWAGERHQGEDTSCHVLDHTELAGEVVLWGEGNKVDDAANCCSMCSKFDQKGKVCNVWVWCGNKDICGSKFQNCWLKHQDLYLGLAPGVMASGAEVMWTSGTLPRYSPVEAAVSPGLVIHALQPNQQTSTSPRTRECGSPAVDGYAHVEPRCLERSRTAIEHPKDPQDRVKLEVHVETAADFDGLAVVWGLGFKQPSAAACAEACLKHVPPGERGGVFGRLPCNAFTWCPTEHELCFEADAHTHHGGDCWLKFTEVPEAPEVNQRGLMDQPGTVKNGHPFHSRHKAPPVVQWVAGVLLPPGVKPSNGTWGPRAQW
mmetsp:Transcript_16133/g.22284  ORF Transcript_16133/g.22284 Transcript_16133/m.22284 type:complete len:350 (-) Transcript_16133:166-1215(-)|eukprot:CAMPEP_0196576978 /NCGR_PEP_ID=MMETSP1081-20130531/6133_1 /TAXON_ID=36882 /ORGANISM="Pyramimonas amylifera, Strain CCMP720" /LENGTH=349 /DNA_ID=CAMNT_0041895753 /DNA_START=37 /DNA_END=1086 /DNA_ORIENTATION=-